MKRLLASMAAAVALAVGVPGVASAAGVGRPACPHAVQRGARKPGRGFLLVEIRLHHGWEVLLPQPLPAGARAGRGVGRQRMVHSGSTAAGGDLELVADRDLVCVSEKLHRRGHRVQHARRRLPWCRHCRTVERQRVGRPAAQDPRAGHGDVAERGVLHGSGPMYGGRGLGPAGISRPLAERWNGHAWVIQPALHPAGASLSELNAVSCATATSCLAVGTIPAVGSSMGTPLAESWDGSAWTLQSIPGHRDRPEP